MVYSTCSYNRTTFLTIFFLCLFLLSFVYAEEKQDFDQIVVRRNAEQIFTLDKQLLTQLPAAGSAAELSAYLPLEADFKGAQAVGQADFSLRGAGFESTAISVSGRRINDPQTGHFNCDIPLTSADIECVELQGPSARLAPAAIGGSLDFVRRTPLENENKAVLGAGGHSLSNCLLSFTRSNGESGARISLSQKRSSGFREDTAFDNKIASFSGLLSGDNTKFEFNWGAQDKYFGAYDFYTPGQGYLSEERTRTQLTDLQFTLEQGDWQWKPFIFWRRHYDTFLLDRSLLRSTYINHNRSDNFRPGLDIVRNNLWEGNLSGGMEYGLEKIVSRGLGNHRREIPAYWLGWEIPAWNSFSGGVQGRIDLPESGDKLSSGSVDLGYALSQGYALKSSVSLSRRLPSFTELYYSDPTTRGSDSLKFPRALTYEAGLERSLKDLNWQAVGFYRRDKNLIDWIKRDLAQTSWLAENLSVLETAGLEGRCRLKLARMLSLSCNYAYSSRLHSEEGISYKYGPGYTRHLAGAVFSFNLPFGIQSLALHYKKKPGRSAWITVDLSLRREINKYAVLYCQVSNILNSEYQDIEGIANPGRWLEAGIELNW